MNTNYLLLQQAEAQYLHEHGEVLVLRGHELYTVKPHGQKQNARIPGRGLCHVGYACMEGKPRLYALAEEQKHPQACSKAATFSGAVMINGTENADQLWRTSIFKSEEPDSRTNNPNLKIHRRTAEMRTGTQSYQVLLTAKIYSTKNDVSELHMVEIIK